VISSGQGFDQHISITSYAYFFVSLIHEILILPCCPQTALLSVLGLAMNQRSCPVVQATNFQQQVFGLYGVLPGGNQYIFPNSPLAVLKYCRRGDRAFKFIIDIRYFKIFLACF
jgi:hypothetical protein